MNPALLQATGLPTRGLVCWHDLWFPNILLQSNTFGTTWAATRASVIESASVYAPGSTTRKAWKLVEDNTAANNHKVTQTATNAAGSATLAVRGKAEERTWLGLLFPGVGASGYFDLQNGLVGTTTGGTGGISNLGNGWYECRFSIANAPAAAVVDIRIAEADNDSTFDGTGTVPYAEDDPGLYIADAQLYPSATLPPYVPTTSLQTIPDLSGHGNHLYRGSNPGAADSNDPTILGPGLGFVTDDFGPTGNLSGVTMAGDWTALIAGLLPGVSGRVWTLGVNNDEHQDVLYDGAGFVKLGTRHGGAGTTYSANGLQVSGVSPVVLVVQHRSGVLFLTRDGTGEGVSLASLAPVGVPVLTLGNLPPGGTSIASAMTMFSHLLYNRVPSNGEIQRACRFVQAQWKARGVVIA